MGNTSRRAAILLHGLGHVRRVMAPMEEQLTRRGWMTANVGYASLRVPFNEHVGVVAMIAADLMAAGATEVSMVGHSLGGLIARAAMARAAQNDWVPGRLVLIGSPAKGSKLADLVSNMKPFKLLTGDCGWTCTTLGARVVPVPDVPTAVIAGGTGGRGYNPLLRGDNDGIVAVQETLIPEISHDFMLTHGLHRSLPKTPDAIASTLRFLESGRLAA